MNSYAQLRQENKSSATAKAFSTRAGSQSALDLTDDHPATLLHRELGERLNQSPHVQSQRQLQQSLDNSPRVATQTKLAQTLSERKSTPQPHQTLQRQEGIDEDELLHDRPETDSIQSEMIDDEEEPLQGKFAEPIQRQENPIQRNTRGLPEQLSAGLETLSGIPMQDVEVEYNSAEPAKVNALATTQGKQIKLGPGQEKHLPHEAWHAVQQKQGRVEATKQLRGVEINDDSGLEREADVMGARALQAKGRDDKSSSVRNPTERDVADGTRRNFSDVSSTLNGPVQRAVGFEFQTNWQINPDLVSGLEGAVSATGKAMTEPFLGEQGAQVMGSLAGKLTRMPLDVAGYLLKGIGSWGYSKLVTAPQTRYRVEGYADTAKSMSQKAVIKGVPLVRGTGWEMSSDEGEMEFVTNHFSEGDYDGLRNTMNDIFAFNSMLMRMRRRPSIPILYLPGATIPGTLASIAPQDDMLGVPQMTAGIAPEQLVEMMRAMGTGRTRQNLTRGRGGLMGLTASSLPAQVRDKRSAQYKGLVALMASYVAQSALLPAASTEKDIATIMSRTNVGFAFKKTTESQKMPVAQLKKMLIKDVLATAQTATRDATHALVVPITAGMRLFPGEDPQHRTGPTVQEWTDGIVEGHDVTSAGMSRLSARSMGAWERMENVGPTSNTAGLIVEFRDLPRDIDYTGWTNYALKLMEWTSIVNNPRRSQKKFPR